ncbi:MAG: ABC transporter permease subunit [Eubacteriales bacterium]
MVSILSAFLNLIVGVLYGSIAGYLGGRVDNVMMRFVESLKLHSHDPLCDPDHGGLGQGIHSIVLAMGLVLWVRMARIVRGQVLHIRNRDYVAAARGLGVPLPVMIWRHFIPNMLRLVLVACPCRFPTRSFRRLS